MGIMKKLRKLCLLCLMCLVPVPPEAWVNAQTSGGSRPREVLTNESVIDLSRAGFKEKTIITLIRTSETAFNISTTKLVELKRRGVKERIISEMIERTNAGEAMRRLTTLRHDDFFSKADEEFFKGSSVYKELPSDKQVRKREGEAQVFGWGGDGERKESTEVTGTATVRILRPGGEAGGAGPTPKLERPPKLDNRGVLDLVQAGFSEGTIIRKIELAQVEFDLSPAALSELKQNRVSDRIIRAMTSAMEESK
ncbi:MAG: hypothetical protein EBU88_10185 [Acidobacteria bacterium]|nr:hypothetical protein [Acidobacteriota bacterium]